MPPSIGPHAVVPCPPRAHPPAQSMPPTDSSHRFVQKADPTVPALPLRPLPQQETPGGLGWLPLRRRGRGERGQISAFRAPGGDRAPRDGRFALAACPPGPGTASHGPPCSGWRLEGAASRAGKEARTLARSLARPVGARVATWSGGCQGAWAVPTVITRPPGRRKWLFYAPVKMHPL